MNNVLFSSVSDNWSTPLWLFQLLDSEFNFDLDPCSSDDNAKCCLHYTIDDNGLLKDWSDHRVFCNPPYGRSIYSWVEKCYNESRKGAFVVALLPVRTDTKWFHDFIYNKAREIRFLKGRLRFGDSLNSAPFPSMVVVF